MDIEEYLLCPINPLRSLHFMFTSRCNLKCLYCPQSCHTSNASVDINQSLLDAIVSYCIERGVKLVGIGHYGETLIYKDWWRTVDILLDHDVEIDLCSNFSHDLDDNEVRVFSRLKRIQMSVDTFDHALLKFLRPPADLSKIIYNLHRIRASALVAGTSPPEIAWNCVITNHSLRTLKEFIAGAASCGVRNIVFNHCVRFENCDEEIKSIFELNDREYIDAFNEIKEAVALAAKFSINLMFGHKYFERTLKDLYDYKVDHGCSDNACDFLASSQTFQALQGRVKFLFDKRFMALEPEMTRSCTSPWEKIYLSAKGEVFACCVDGNNIGTITDAASFDTILNGPAYEKYRRSLLLGQLHGRPCKECPIAHPTTKERFQHDIEKLLKSEHC